MQLGDEISGLRRSLFLAHSSCFIFLACAARNRKRAKVE